MKKIKILTIAFNGYGKYLPRLLESIDAQTVKPEEVIIVLGKDHGYEWKKKKGVRVIETDLTCLGSLINVGMEFVNDWVLCFNADDVLLPNAIEDIKKVKADVITLKYLWDGSQYYKKGIYGTPVIDLEKLKDWQKYYIGPSGYLAFKKQRVLESDFWQWPLLWKSKFNGLVIKETAKPCAEWILRPKSHGSGKNVDRAIEFLDKEAKRYSSPEPTLSIFSIVRDEEDMCEEAWESVKDADELVICIDDRTTDKTPEIAKKFTDKIYYFKWNDSFAEAKNFALSKCTKEWVMGIDGDCLLKTGIKSIKRAIQQTECDMIDVTLYPVGRDWQKHVLPKIFKNDIIEYYGQAHEYPIGKGKKVSRDFNTYGVEIEYDYSPNHAKDPDRYIRILKKALKNEPNGPRWKFYLAREYLYRTTRKDRTKAEIEKDHKSAISLYEEYIEISKFLAEKADAYLSVARSYWATNQGDKARASTLKAIEINPNFKEALLFMSSIVWPRHRQRWLDYANLADNSEVLFIRV